MVALPYVVGAHATTLLKVEKIFSFSFFENHSFLKNSVADSKKNRKEPVTFSASVRIPPVPKNYESFLLGVAGV